MRWTFRILVLPDLPPKTNGPYAILRHPNYAAILGDRELESGTITMRRLAGALKVQPGALYWHFPNKQALLGAVADGVSPVSPGAFSELPGPPPSWPARVPPLSTVEMQVSKAGWRGWRARPCWPGR